MTEEEFKIQELEELAKLVLLYKINTIHLLICGIFFHQVPNYWKTLWKNLKK